jgi:hypothetical protein
MYLENHVDDRDPVTFRHFWQGANHTHPNKVRSIQILVTVGYQDRALTLDQWILPSRKYGGMERYLKSFMVLQPYTLNVWHESLRMRRNFQHTSQLEKLLVRICRG